MAAQALLSTTGPLLLGGSSVLGSRISNITQHFCIPLLDSNPKLVEMFAQRDKQPYQSLLPWSGEFAGKYITHSAQIYLITRDQNLKIAVQQVVDLLRQYQTSDGYLGPWPSQYEFKKGAPNPGGDEPWDAWGHYHIMYGCMRWNEATGDDSALQIAKNISSKLVATFGGDPKKLYACGAYEQNSAILHSMACMYQLTNDASQLALCNTILQEIQIPPCGDYVRNALAGKQFYQGSQPRWEGLITVLGIAQMYWATGNSQYSQAYQQIWYSLCEFERHNNGGMMSGEQAQGSPYDQRSVETCCTVTWGAMCVSMLQLTGSPIVADELELSLFNSGLFLESPSGRWCTYNSAMSGVRESTTIQLAFQARDGSSELSCCSVNGPRMFGLLSDWAIMYRRSPNRALIINLYAPMAATVSADGTTYGVKQDTNYPVDNSVKVQITPPSGVGAFSVLFRIPCWSAKTTFSINGQQSMPAPTGQYLSINRVWSTSDVVELTFDFRLRGWMFDAPIAAVAAPPPARLPTAVAPPSPKWNSATDGKWSANGKQFTGSPDELIVIDASDPVINNGPSSMVGWFVCARTDVGADSPGIPFSTGAGKVATPNMARGLDLFGGNVNYFNGGASHDDTNLLDTDRARDWGNVILSQQWHHVAISDDGTTVQFFVDGQLWASKQLNDPTRETQGGFMVAGWADRNRYFTGYLAGVQLFLTALSADDVSAIMSATKPSKVPEFPSSLSIYRGPLLLGFDPRFNSAASAPTLDGDDLSYTIMTAGSWLKPQLLLEFKDKDGQPVFLTDFGSLGLTGLQYSTWMQATFSSPPAPTPFSKSNPTRTSILPEPSAPIKLVFRHASGTQTHVLPAAMQRLSKLLALLLGEGAPAGSPSSVRLQWLDDEEDWISVTSQDELDEAFRHARQLRQPLHVRLAL